MKTLALMLLGSLEKWGVYQPECCEHLSGDAYRVTTGAITFDVSVDVESEPSQSLLQAIDRAVCIAAQKRGWRTVVECETDNSDLHPNYIARTLLGVHVVERECGERTIARLQSYLAASRGDY